MQLKYKVEFDNPQNHIVNVKVVGKPEAGMNSMVVFLPVWSPGSYLVREYSKNIRFFSAKTNLGQDLNHQQIDKCSWKVALELTDSNAKYDSFEIFYQVYCHEFSVRTSHVDASHAYLHGPSYLMGVSNTKISQPEIELVVPPAWSKVSTALKDISPKREVFRYSAEDYDELIDCPIEIGCHETDGFMYQDKPHELAFSGVSYPHQHNLKADIQKIVKHIGDFMGDLPYEKYTFLTHFAPDNYGGLEHRNSCALLFDGTKLNIRKDYLNWLSLVAHEYFHTWNVKRIRPLELGPFEYDRENYTTMLWLAEGLTSFMDELFVYRTGLSTIDEYLEQVRSHINRYLGTPGRKFHSLEQSSFNAWIKLYRPDENSLNSTVSYYLKGGLVFFVLNVLLQEKNHSINELVKKLWDDFKGRPARGINSEQVYQLVEEIGGSDVRVKFEEMISTVFEIDLEKHFNTMGCEFEWDNDITAYLGIQPRFVNDNVYIQTVILDGPAYKSGLNAGDEIISLNKVRVTKNNFDTLKTTLLPDTVYQVCVSRLGCLEYIDLLVTRSPRELMKIKVVDGQKVAAFLRN